MENDVTLVAKQHTSTPQIGAHRVHRTGLPTLLLTKARHRLGFLCVLFSVLFLTDTMFVIGFAGDRAPLLLADILAFSLAAIVAVLARWPRIPTGLVLDLGLLLEVALCFLISLSMTRFYYGMYAIIPLMDWVTPVIILFPLIVPTPPTKSLVASLMAASAPPLSILLLAWRGVIALDPIPVPGANVHPAFAASWSPIMAVIIAWFASRWMYGMGKELAKARKLGSYQLESLLGHGGMGEVWRARHRMLARPAAIKLIRPEVLGGGGAESPAQTIHRFEREARATAAMRSYHTIQVYDFGVSEEGDFYYVMELLEGFSCDVLVSKFGALRPARVVHLLEQVCDSLAEAHGAGLIHRDIKPANIFVCRYGREVDFVKVLDFGLVRSQRKTGGNAVLTAETLVGGTPAFMAPEQVLGTPSPDARMDLYAIGCLGYWLLTGQLVFDGKTPLEIMTHHARTDPTPPSRRTELDVPEALDHLILTCLEKDPERRPASAEVLGQEFMNCVDGSVWTREMARDWWNLYCPSQTERESEMLHDSFSED